MLQPDLSSRNTSISASANIALALIICAGPFAAVLGNAASDIWLVLVSVLFLVIAVREKSFSAMRQLWFGLAAVFWLWAMLSAGFSETPFKSLKSAAEWIRFPLFALALYSLVSLDKRSLDWLMMSAIAATLVFVSVLFGQKLMAPDSIHLHGTWSQSTKAGWFLVGVGMPSALWLLAHLVRHQRTVLPAFLYMFILVFASFLSGQIYKTASMLLGFGLFFFITLIFARYVIAMGLVGVASVAAVLIFDKWAYVRFVEQPLARLPWRETSDYFMPWVTGLRIGFDNILLGIGPANYNVHCNKVFDVAKEFPLTNWPKCAWHPHQIYIQYFAETGLIGVLIFIACVLALVGSVMAVLAKAGRQNLYVAAAFSVILVAFWPLSTYSQAFGQHANFFTWFLVGLALLFADQKWASDGSRLPKTASGKT